MSRAEFLSWAAYYRLYPFDDFHRFHRPAALIAATMADGEVGKRLEWLQPDRSAPTAEAGNYSDADMATLKAFGIKTKKG